VESSHTLIAIATENPIPWKVFTRWRSPRITRNTSISHSPGLKELFSFSTLEFQCLKEPVKSGDYSQYWEYYRWKSEERP